MKLKKDYIYGLIVGNPEKRIGIIENKTLNSGLMQFSFEGKYCSCIKRFNYSLFSTIDGNLGMHTTNVIAIYVRISSKRKIFKNIFCEFVILKND